MQIKKGSLSFRTNAFKKTLTFTIGQPVNFPGVLTIEARSEKLPSGNRIQVSIIPQHPIEIEEIYLQADFPFSETDKIFCNGFQSWSESGEYGINEQFNALARTTHLYKMQYYGDSHFLPSNENHRALRSQTYAYIRRDSMIYFAGSLFEACGYTLFFFDPSSQRIRIHKECQGLTVHDFYCAFDLVITKNDENSVFDAYSRLVNPDYHSGEVLTGWSSRNFSGKMSEKSLLDILHACKQNRIPIDIFHIHDGYQNRIGDWLAINRAFPRKMAYLAEQIHDCGYRASLWLAPFICEKKSKIYKQQNWLATQTDGSHAVAGASIKWGGNLYALDCTLQEVRDYLARVIDTILNQWNFDMLFVDYLHAAAIVPKNGKNRGQLMSEALQFLRDCAGERILAGSCMPLGSSWSYFKYGRVSADITPKWEDWFLKKANFRERRSTFNALKSVIGRRQINRRLLVNVSDLFCIESENNQLTADQKYTLCLLQNLFCGLVLTSDTIAAYSSNEMRQYGSVFPLRPKKIRKVTEKDGLYTINFTISGLEYLVYANLDDQHRNIQLPEGNYFWRNPLNDNFHFISGQTPIMIPPFATRCYLKIISEKNRIAGSTAHIFPGSEITDVRWTDNEIIVTQSNKVIKENMVFIQTPEKRPYLVNGETIEAREFFDQLYVVPVIFQRAK